MGLGAAIAVAQTGVWGASLVEIFSLTSIPLLVAAIMSLALVHEFGHALTLKHYGGTVHEMGFLLMYFQPAFYCNISDTYLLPGRKPRILVGLAGLFFQGMATALAIVAWRVLEPGTILANFFWVFVAVSLAIFLFNLNPLIKLDGYYILVDWLRIPNLRAKAFSYWRALLKRWLWGTPTPVRTASARERRIYRWYGILAAAYTALFAGVFIYLISRWLFGHWGVVGVAIGWGLVLGFAISSKASSSDQSAKPAAQTSDMTESVGTSRRWLKPLIFWGILAIVIAVLAVVQAERRVGSPCEVEAGSRFVVTSPVGGTLETMLMEGPDSLGSGLAERRERSILQATASDFSFIAYNLHVREGDSVNVGDTLVALSSNRYHATLAATEAKRDRIAAERNLLLSGPKQDAIKELRAEIQEASATVQNRETELQRKKMMYDRNLIAENEYEGARTALEVAKAQRQAKNSKLALLISDPKAEELAIKDSELQSLEAEIEFFRTQISASTVLSPIAGEVAQVERGGVLVELADLDPVRLHLSVHENDIAEVRVGAPVSLKVRSLPFEEFHGQVAKISDLADTLGQGRRFLVITEMPNEVGKLKPGMSGFAKIECGKRSVLALISRRMVQFVRVEFWSWW
jgi:multidrug efflux pump subunit AcrA (membrane-fusion protein)/Zn-dependent protease